MSGEGALGAQAHWSPEIVQNLRAAPEATLIHLLTLLAEVADSKDQPAATRDYVLSRAQTMAGWLVEDIAVSTYRDLCGFKWRKFNL